MKYAEIESDQEMLKWNLCVALDNKPVANHWKIPPHVTMQWSHQTFTIPKNSTKFSKLITKQPKVFRSRLEVSKEAVRVETVS
jgi:hypothetical protein